MFRDTVNFMHDRVTSRNFTLGTSWVLAPEKHSNPVLTVSKEQDRGIRTLHIVPQGHGGGYIDMFV